MSNIAQHMRMTGLQVTDDDVDSRKKTSADLTVKWGKLKSFDQILQKASEIADAIHGDGQPTAAFGAEVQAAVQTHASAFLYIERPLEVGICAGTAIVDLVSAPAKNEDGWAGVDWLATAIWSAVSYQAPLEDAKRETLRNEVLEACRDRALSAAEHARTRSVVPDFADFVPAASEEGKAAFKKSTASTIAALRRNATLDREELDFLWWSQVTRSRLLDVVFQSLLEPVRVVACGLEAGQLVKRLPCDVHREIALRGLDTNPSLDLKELLDAIGEHRSKLIMINLDGVVAKTPAVFPLLTALQADSAEGLPSRTVKRSCADWGSRALLESAMAALVAAPGIPAL